MPRGVHERGTPLALVHGRSRPRGGLLTVKQSSHIVQVYADLSPAARAEYQRAMERSHAIVKVR